MPKSVVERDHGDILSNIKQKDGISLDLQRSGYIWLWIIGIK